MKKTILSITLLCSGLISINAQNAKYVSAMEKNLSQFDTATTIQNYQSYENAFERIAGLEKKEWLPVYYAAFANIKMAFNSKGAEAVDSYCDKADKLLAKCDSLSPKNSEVYTLKGLCAQARIGVDPMSRGQKYGMEASMDFDQAKSFDASNPRIYYLIGQNKYYTPEQWGGGKKKALPILEDALKKFETFKPASTIHPNWGLERTKKLIEECKK